MSSLKEFLTFQLGTEQYAVEILRVQEIRGWENPDPLPNVPSYVKGVVDLRGVIVPIVDLREKFNLEVSYDATTVVIVVHVFMQDGERVIGLVVDSVSDVHQFDISTLQPAPDVSTSIDSHFVLGLGTVGNPVKEEAPVESLHQKKGVMVIVIDVDKLATEGLIEGVLNHFN